LRALPVGTAAGARAGGGVPPRGDAASGARVGILPRLGTNADVRWFEIDPCYVFHPMNAYADGSRVVCDVARHEYMWRTSMNDFTPSYLHRWMFDLETGSVAEQQLDDGSLGFPRVDDRAVGLRHRVGWAVAPRPGSGGRRWADSAGVVVKYDLAKGTSSYHDFGPHAHPDEFVFAEASARSGEDEGWVMGYV